MKRPMAYHSLSDVVGFDAVMLVAQRYNHRLIATVGLKHVHAMKAKGALMRQVLESRKSRKSRGAEVDPIEKAEDEIDASAQCGQVKWSTLAVAFDDIGKESGL